MTAAVPPPADTAALCCDCMCEHQCAKDPAVIGHQGCVACKWCSCRAHPVSTPPAEDTPDLLGALQAELTARIAGTRSARRLNSDDVVVHFPISGCPIDSDRHKHVHAQTDWRSATGAAAEETS